MALSSPPVIMRKQESIVRLGQKRITRYRYYLHTFDARLMDLRLCGKFPWPVKTIPMQRRYCEEHDVPVGSCDGKEIMSRNKLATQETASGIPSRNKEHAFGRQSINPIQLN